MKINSKSLAQKLAVAKKAVATKKVVAPKVTDLSALKSYNCKHLIQLGEQGLGTNLGLAGREILDGYVRDLIVNKEKLTSARLAATDKVLLIESPMWQRRGPTLFAWPVVKQSGDVLEVRENYWRAPKANLVRTTLSLLKKHVAAVKEGSAPTVVRLVSKATALAEIAKHKTHMGSKAVMGVS